MSDLRTIKAIIRFFVSQQLRYPRLLLGMLIAHPLAILVFRFLPALLVADILRRLSEHDFSKGDLWGSFGWDLLAVIGLEALGGILLWRITIFFNWTLEGYVTRNIERQVFDHLMRMSPNFHANNFAGSLVSQTSKLAGAYVRFTDTSVFQLAGLIWALVFTTVLLASTVPMYAVALIVFTILYLAAAVAVTGKLRRLNAEEAEASNKQTGQLADSVTNVLAVKAFAAAQTEKERFAAVSENTRHATVRLMWGTLKRETLFGTMGTGISAVALVAAAGSVVLFDANIATVFLVLNYTTDILTRLWEFNTQGIRNYNRVFGDAQAMTDILALEPEIKDPVKPEKPRIKNGAIEFKGMSFTHPESRSDDSLFHNLQLTIAPSEKIGLVGHSGSGKTTLTKLLLRFNDIDGGEILIDGQNIAHLTQEDLRRHIAYVPQEPLLFHRSIRENIAYGKPGASNQAVRAAAKKAYAHEFIEKLPHGYETLVGERGVKLSGGQRQRIAIARAILKDAPILVLDEATSALDSESEKAIQAALWKLMEGRTAIVIAHRLSTVQKMDRILVLEEGTIVEQGTHRELLKAKGVYASLWAHQSGGFIDD